ncbi:hypothetical protein [Streptomyces achromogenes]|uniref:DinB/UmuC family translesion DNA polymerase n=1 Tax=Streptomyces achromogenes TaxID=67255 RepID=UPI003A80BA72
MAPAVIAPDDASVAAFLRLRPLTALPGIGRAIAKTHPRFGITTIGDLADTPTAALARILGAHAAHRLQDSARSFDDRLVQRSALVRTVSVSHRFDHDELVPAAHRGAPTSLADQLGARLRTSGEACRSLVLIVRLADRSALTRSRTLPEPTPRSPALRKTAHGLYARLHLERARVRELVLGAEGLIDSGDSYHQMLLDPVDDRQRRLERTADGRFPRGGLSPGLSPNPLATATANAVSAHKPPEPSRQIAVARSAGPAVVDMGTERPESEETAFTGSQR